MNKEERDPVVLSWPEAGVTNSIVVSPGSDIILEGNFAEAVASRHGTDLEFAFDKGGTGVLVNFFTMPTGASVILQLPDGTQVSAIEMARALEQQGLQTGP